MARISNKDGAMSLALKQFENVKTLEIIDGEFAIITQEMTVCDFNKALDGLDVLNSFMFA